MSIHNNTDVAFEYFDEGFVVELKMAKMRLLWKDVKELHGYKMDLFTTDEICLDIILQESVLTLNESMNGFQEFLKILQNKFPSIDKDWFLKITQPPFATNFTILYKKD